MFVSATLLAVLPFLLVAPALCYGLFSMFCAARFFSRPCPEALGLLPVTIIKPVKGLDAESYENFASFCCQDYPDYQVLFAVASPDDPVIAVIERLRVEYASIPIDLVIDNRVYGYNYKVCNLINAYPAARHDLIIVCDSDIRVGPEYLRNVVGLFANPAVGLVTSLYRSSTPPNAAAALEALGFSAEMVPNVLVARHLEGLTFALGASMAVRRQALENIGGFAALVDYLADDYQLGNMVHRAGYRVELSSHCVESVMKPESLAGILSRQVRWARTMRVSRPGGYAASGIVQPALSAGLALVVSGFSSSGFCAIALLGIMRVIQCLQFSRHYVSDMLLPRYLWLLPIRDVLATATWCAAFFGNRVIWRDHVFRVRSGGRMVADNDGQPCANQFNRP